MLFFPSRIVRGAILYHPRMETPTLHPIYLMRCHIPPMGTDTLYSMVGMGTLLDTPNKGGTYLPIVYHQWVGTLKEGILKVMVMGTLEGVGVEEEGVVEEGGVPLEGTDHPTMEEEEHPTPPMLLFINPLPRWQHQFSNRWQHQFTTRWQHQSTPRWQHQYNM